MYEEATARTDSSAAPSSELLLALADIGHELATAEASSRLARTLHALELRLGATRSALFRADPDRRSLELEAAHGVSADAFRPRYGKGVAGRVAESGEPLVVPVVCRDAMALSELTSAASFRDPGWNLVTVPVFEAGRCTGALSAYFPERGAAAFSERLRALEVVATLLQRGAPARNGRERLPGTGTARELRGPVSSLAPFEYANMIGGTPSMRQVYDQVAQVARTSITALLHGESGTGKELAALAIHHNSPRADAPFVKVNCAAVPEALFESELFGHERGAFTGAHARKKGRFELAEGGTLFLDEIGELPLTVQAKLLRALQFREFERVGGTETLRADVRIVAATNADIERAVREGRFREDLYYRINVFAIHLPPLRERKTDIPALAEYFVEKLARQHGKKLSCISSSALALLAEYPWPGNVRELENAIERAVVVCEGAVMEEHHLPAAVRDAAGDPRPVSLQQAVEQVERRMIEAALQHARGSILAAARALDTTERIVRYKAKKLGIDPGRFRG